MPQGSRRKDVLAALRGAFEARGWHGPSALESLRGLRAGEAAARPAGAHHSIHELVDHIEHWESVGVDLVGSGRRPARARRDWRPPSLRFAASVARMRATHRKLVSAVARLDDVHLDRPTKTDSGAMSLAEVLHGIAAHAAYHAGQIRILRTLLARNPRLPRREQP